MSTETASETEPAEPADEPIRAVQVTHAPARLSGALATGAGLLAVLTTLFGSALALLVGLFGLGGLAAGLFGLHSQRVASLGAAIVFVAVVVGGLFGAPELFVVVGALATVVAFDLSQNAFSVGRQLSTETDTRRGELVHAAATVAVGSVAVVVAFAIYALAAGGQPISALAFILLASIVLVWAVRS